MSPSHTKASSHLVLVVAALLLAAFLASHSMSSDFLWWDEHWSVQIAGTGVYGPISLEQVWQNASADPWHPPAFYVILAGWAQVFGSSQFALRLFPFFTGVLALAWTYRFGAWAGGRRVGVASLLILCGAAFFLDFMTELRPYMLYALFGIMCPALYWRFVAGKPNAIAPLLFAFSVLGLLYAHYFAALVAVALGIYHLLFVRKNRLWWRVIAYAIGGAALFIPWLYVFLTAVEIASGGERYNVLSNEAFAGLLADGISNGFIPFVLVYLLGSVVAWRSRAGKFTLWTFGVILVLALAINLRLQVLAHLRYIIVVWGLAAVVAGYGAAWLWQQADQGGDKSKNGAWRWQLARYGRAIALALLIAWWGVGAYNMLTPDFQNRMFRQDFVNIFRPNLPLYAALQTLEPELQSHDVLLLDSPIGDWAVAGGFTYYTGDWSIPRSMLTWLVGTNEAELTPTLRDYTREALRVWFAYETQPPDYHRAAFDALAQDELSYCKTAYSSPDLRVDEYARHPACCGATGNIAAKYDNMTLDTLEVVDQNADSATLLTSWAVNASVPAGKYSVGVYLLDDEGNVLAQADTGLPAYAYSCQTMTLPLTDIPAGEYDLKMTVYDWQTLERLSGTASAETGEVLPVTKLVIEDE